MNHVPFDYGALHTLGLLARQKSIKSICGKRVTYANADPHAAVTCPDCRAKLESDIADDTDFVATCTDEKEFRVRMLARQRIEEFSAMLARK